MPEIPELGRLKQAGFWFLDRTAQQSECEASWGSIVRLSQAYILYIQVLMLNFESLSLACSAIGIVIRTPHPSAGTLLRSLH